VRQDPESQSDAELAFSIHLVRLAIPERRRTIRVLLVAAVHINGVYERLGTRLQCGSWIDEFCPEALSAPYIRKLLRTLERNSYAALPEVWIAPHRLDALGFQRIDK
jgi:hypothetical protein